METPTTARAPDEDDEVLTEHESDATLQAERYAYAELKEAQRRCGEKAVAAALRACGSASTAQRKVRSVRWKRERERTATNLELAGLQVFQAHVNDLCASVFIAMVRQYNPDTKGAAVTVVVKVVVRTSMVLMLVRMRAEDVEPVDQETVAKVEALEKRLREKEAAVKQLREKVDRVPACRSCC